MENHQKRFLIADDEEGIRHLLKMVLSKKYAGSTIDESENGQDFLEKARSARLSAPYTLYLLDQRMPAVKGYDALTALRSEGDTTPAVLFTGTGFDINESALPNAFRLLSKPCTAQEVLATIEDLLHEESKSF